MVRKVALKKEAITVHLKADYIRYFEDLPIQKYAAMYIGKNEDTIIRWKKDDANFARAVLKAKAEWIRKKAIATKAEFALERLESEIFGRKQADVDLTVKMPTPIIYYPHDLPYEAVTADVQRTQKPF